MRSQCSILAHTTKSLGSLTLTTGSHDQLQQCRSATPSSVQQHSPLIPCAQQTVQMTTGGGLGGNNNNNNSNSSHSQSLSTAQQKSGTSNNLSSCNTIASTSSLNTLNNKSTPSIVRHSNGSITNNNNNNNNNNHTTTTKSLSTKNNNNNESNNNQNPNWSKLQTLEQRKLELEKLLNEKNWLLQQIHKQEAQILNGNYENFNLLDLGTSSSAITNSILRRKGSSSLKLNKSNVHFNGKNNRLTLSKSEYDLAQENKLNNQSVVVAAATNQTVMGIKKRQGPPQKTNSFHDSTSTSALSLTKSPSFEYNGGLGGSESSSHSIKYSIARPHHGSTENLTNCLAVTQCDKYYLSPTNQMYSDGSGFIKASQNIKQCLSPSPLHKIIALNDTDMHRMKQQQMHSSNGHTPVHHNGSQSHLEQYETLDTLSLSPSTTCAFDQGQFVANQHSNLWRTISNSDRSAWCDSTSYVELDSDGGNPYNTMKPLPTKLMPTSISGSCQQSSDSSSLGQFYAVGSGLVVNSYPSAIDKACDEVSISSVNSESNKKPKNKQWMESSLDGPIIRPNILQSSSSNISETIALYPALSPTLSQNPQYPYYNMSRQVSSSAAVASGKLTPSPGPAAGGSSLLVSVVNSRPPTRALTHHAHPHHKQGYRERTKLSSKSMSSGSYRSPKTKLDDDNSHLSHSTSYLNVDPYHHHHFHLQSPPQQQQQQHQQQQQQQQTYHHSHYHMEMPTSSNFAMPHLQQQQQQHQKANKPAVTPSTSQQHIAVALPKFSPSMQHQSAPSINGDDFDGTIRYAASVASSQPSKPTANANRLNHSPLQKPAANAPPSHFVSASQQQHSPQSNSSAVTSPDIRIESPKNMTIVQQATFLPYKEVTKPFEMSDFYKYSTKFRQKDANTATISKSST